MIVKVIPDKPITGILPKNKILYDEQILDLNKAEIIRCMQFGSVYREDGELIDENQLNLMNKNGNFDFSSWNKIENVDITPEFVINKIQIPNNEVIIQNEVPSPIISDIPKEPIYSLKEIKQEEQDEYTILRFIFNIENESIVEGNIYGLFSIKGNRPESLEYNNEDNWMKFNNKFMNCKQLENNHEFVFRIKSNSSVKYRICIKESNRILAELNGESILNKK